MQEREIQFQSDILELIKELKTEVYSVIDDFVERVKLLLWDHFNIEEDIEFDLQIIEGLMQLTV